MDVLNESESCAKGPAILRDGFCWPLARIAQAMMGLLNVALADQGLTMRSFAVLAMVGHGSARSQLEIAQTVGLDKSTLVATIDELERRGLVERRPDPTDRRARIVESTAAGGKVLAQASDTVRDAEARILANLPRDEADRIKSSLIALLGGPLHDEATRAGSCL